MSLVVYIYYLSSYKLKKKVKVVIYFWWDTSVSWLQHNICWCIQKMLHLCLRCFLPGTSSFCRITNGDSGSCQSGPAPDHVSTERGRFQQLHCQPERAGTGERQKQLTWSQETTENFQSYDYQTFLIMKHLCGFLWLSISFSWFCVFSL